MLNLIIVAVLFFLMVFSTFFVVQLPFITFLFADVPSEVTVTYSNSLIAMGYFLSSMQIPVVILSSLLLNPRLNFFFISIYYLIGLYGVPIFYSGGGKEYLHQPTIGYLLSFLPVSILLSRFAWKDNNYKRYLFNSRYIFFLAFVALLAIHFIGLITAFFILGANSRFLTIFQAYFYIPFLSQLLLIAVTCIIATNLNRFKFYMLSRYMRFVGRVLKNSTKRRQLAKK